MNIGIDLRALLNPVKTGVGEYADELIMNILGTPNQHRFFLFYNAVKPAPHLEKYSSYPNANLVATRWPNKVFNAATALFNYPRIDALIKKQTGQTIDLFFSPNLNLTALSSTTPHFLTIHDISFEFFPECFSRRQRLWHAAINPREVSRRAAAITTPSEHTRRDVAEYYGVDERKIHVLMPGLSSGFNTHLAALDTEQLLRARADYDLPERFILFLGTIEPRKNIPALIDGFERYLDETHDRELHLIIAGAPGWNNAPILKKIAHTRFPNNIRHIGYVKPDDKAALYRLAETFAYPSRYEGFGFPVLEAFAAGTPVITSWRASLGEIAQNAAYYIDPRQAATITEGLIQLRSSPALRDTLVARGRRQAELFSYARMAKEWLSVAEHITLQNGG